MGALRKRTGAENSADVGLDHRRLSRHVGADDIWAGARTDGRRGQDKMALSKRDSAGYRRSDLVRVQRAIGARTCADRRWAIATSRSQPKLYRSNGTDPANASDVRVHVAIDARICARPQLAIARPQPKGGAPTGNRILTGPRLCNKALNLTVGFAARRLTPGR